MCFCAISASFSTFTYAETEYVASSPQYARVKSANVKLYKTATEVEDYSNYYFFIPETYFVELTGYENEKFFCARYLDVVGYVKISEVQCVAGLPQKPFASQMSFRIFIPSGIELRSSPTQSEGLNALSNINFLETNLQYYGTANGEEAISYKGNVWYYCKYFKADTELQGYVYSAYCDLLSTLQPNTEVLEYVDEPTFQTKDTSADPANTDASISKLPSTTQILIIVAICVPCILIIYLIFRPTKITARCYNDGSKKKQKRSRKQDYYEYEE